MQPYTISNIDAAEIDKQNYIWKLFIFISLRVLLI